MIPIRSFRVRITLLSVLLSGLVLVVFSAGTWTLFYRTTLNRLDRDILEVGERRLSFPRPAEHWEELTKSLEVVYGPDEEDGFFVAVKNQNGDIAYQSSSWPASLSAEVIPTPDPRQFRDRDDGPRPERAPRAAFRDRRPPPPDGVRPPPPDERRRPRGEYPPPHDRRAPPGDEPAFRQNDERPRPPRRPPGPLPLADPVLSTVEADGAPWRLAIMGNPDVTLALGVNLDQFHSDMAGVRNIFLAILAGALALIGAGSWFLSQRALKPIQTLTREAETITAKGLDRRIPPANEDTEFQRLVGVFNGMLERLERSFHQATRFSADAAHELKTPLAVLQGELEQAVQEAPSGSDQQRLYNNLLQEVQRLKSIIRKLLLLSVADAGQLKLNRESVDLSAAIEAMSEDARIMAPNLTIQTKITSDVWVQADGDLLRQALQNLVNNAVKYTPEGGRVGIQLNKNHETIRIAVSNTGSIIPESERDRIFDRFYRADTSRDRRSDGTGLGLSLAREIVSAHGGTLALEKSDEAETRFVMTLPLTSA